MAKDRVRYHCEGRGSVQRKNLLQDDSAWINYVDRYLLAVILNLSAENKMKLFITLKKKTLFKMPQVDKIKNNCVQNKLH